ncbi:MAG TPA: hypothetical protein VL068_11135 [Microthrixaceae bacterium]|nr:hypothetical protein [Microthrixaceae bacterium]
MGDSSTGLMTDGLVTDGLVTEGLVTDGLVTGHRRPGRNNGQDTGRDGQR